MRSGGDVFHTKEMCFPVKIKQVNILRQFTEFVRVDTYGYAFNLLHNSSLYQN